MPIPATRCDWLCRRGLANGKRVSAHLDRARASLQAGLALQPIHRPLVPTMQIRIRNTWLAGKLVAMAAAWPRAWIDTLRTFVAEARRARCCARERWHDQNHAGIDVPACARCNGIQCWNGAGQSHAMIGLQASICRLGVQPWRQPSARSIQLPRARAACTRLLLLP